MTAPTIGDEGRGRSLTVGSCFAGIGGLDLGLERAGMTVRWQIEKDEFCSRVLAKHWPNVTRYGDINDVGEVEPVDLVCGGLPCQPWSVAGKRGGQSDERDLWPAFWALCLRVRPRFILMEEVPGFAVPDGLGRSLTDLAEGGYDAEWFRLSAADVGAPHLRKRLWLFAYAASVGCGAWWTRRAPAHGEGRDEAERQVADADVSGCKRTQLHERRGRQDEAKAFHQRHGPASDIDRDVIWEQSKRILWRFGEGEYPVHGWWADEPAVECVVHGLSKKLVRWRRASNYAAGNAVVPQVAEAIGLRIMETIA